MNPNDDNDGDQLVAVGRLIIAKADRVDDSILFPTAKRSAQRTEAPTEDDLAYALGVVHRAIVTETPWIEHKKVAERDNKKNDEKKSIRRGGSAGRASVAHPAVAVRPATGKQRRADRTATTVASLGHLLNIGADLVAEPERRRQIGETLEKVETVLADAMSTLERTGPAWVMGPWQLPAMFAAIRCTRHLAEQERVQRKALRHLAIGNLGTVELRRSRDDIARTRFDELPSVTRLLLTNGTWEPSGKPWMIRFAVECFAHGLGPYSAAVLASAAFELAQRRGAPRQAPTEGAAYFRSRDAAVKAWRAMYRRAPLGLTAAMLLDGGYV